MTSNSSAANGETDKYKDLRRKLLERPIGPEFPEFVELEENARHARELWNTVLQKCHENRTTSISVSRNWIRGVNEYSYSVCDSDSSWPWTSESDTESENEETLHGEQRCGVQGDGATKLEETNFTPRNAHPTDQDESDRDEDPEIPGRVAQGTEHGEASSVQSEPLTPTSSFRFLDLPPELRLIVYQCYMQVEAELLKERTELRWRHVPTRWDSMARVENLSRYHSHVWTDWKDGECGLLEQMFASVVRESRRTCQLPKPVYKLLIDYKKEYQNIAKNWKPNLDYYDCPDCQRTNKGIEHQEKHIIRVSHNGYIAENVPALFIVNKQLFNEIWRECIAKNNPFLKVDIQDLNFRPFFRLSRMLTRTTTQTFSMHNVEFELASTKLKCPHRKACWHRYYSMGLQFCNLGKAIRDHWLFGYPLWRPLEKEEFARRRGLLQYWMGLTRGAAALCRLDRTTWESITMTYIIRYNSISAVMTRRKTRQLKALAGLELVQAAICMIARGAELRLGYNGDWKDKNDFYDSESYRYPYRKEASTREYEVVETVLEYLHDTKRILTTKLEPTEDWEGHFWGGLWWKQAVPDVDVI